MTNVFQLSGTVLVWDISAPSDGYLCYDFPLVRHNSALHVKHLSLQKKFSYIQPLLQTQIRTLKSCNNQVKESKFKQQGKNPTLKA